MAERRKILNLFTAMNLKTKNGGDDQSMRTVVVLSRHVHIFSVNDPNQNQRVGEARGDEYALWNLVLRPARFV